MGDWDTPLGVLLACPIDCAVLQGLSCSLSSPSDVILCDTDWNLLQAQIMSPTLSR